MNQSDLGICFDEQLTFTNHITQVICKSNVANASILKLFHFSSQNVKIQLFNLFVRPIIDYHSIIWAPIAKSSIKSIERINQRFTKKLLRNKQCMYVQRLNKLNLLSLEDRRLMSDLSFLYKIISAWIKDVNLQSFGLELGKLIHLCNNLAAKFPINKARDRVFSQRIIQHWNSLPESIKQAKSVSMFKMKVKTWLMSKYQTYT